MKQILVDTLTELSSWRIASTLVKRHPKTITAFIGHPGGGQSNVLWLINRVRQNPKFGSIMLNRSGSIHVEHRFDGKSREELISSPRTWEQYLSGDNIKFVQQLENAAGLPNVARSPTTSKRVLTYQVLAHLLARDFQTGGLHKHSLSRYTVKSGYRDAAGQRDSEVNPVQPPIFVH